MTRIILLKPDTPVLGCLGHRTHNAIKAGITLNMKTSKPMENTTDPQHQNDMDKVEAWDVLIQQGVSEDTLQVVTAINGWSLSTMEKVLYAVTGYRSFDQLREAGE